VFEPLIIESHRGKYTVRFGEKPFAPLQRSPLAGAHFIIDAKVASLYPRELEPALSSGAALLIEATETNKSLHRFPEYVEHLVSHDVRKTHRLVAIGGGIIQDITCFLAATLLRGIPWHFYPTTLLAQADSCIGSKSSINVGDVKNILGTFTPPVEIYVSTEVLETLEGEEVRSGIGEMLKVHAIKNPAAFDGIAADYDRLYSDNRLLEGYIYHSLEIKKGFIEIDEFDQGPRNVMNYGHTFGHAIESATGFEIPHGIAVTMGMDMANYLSLRLGLTTASHYQRMHGVLKTNFMAHGRASIPLEPFLGALRRDKKHTDDELRVILPDSEGRITIRLLAGDQGFQDLCADYLSKELSA
jgi:3-dehydroquinate synthase